MTDKPVNTIGVRAGLSWRRVLLLGTAAAVAAFWFGMAGGQQPTAARSFTPERIAHFEAAGWRAYYDRNWLRVLGLMVQLNREQFGMSWPVAGLAALDVVRASLAFAPVDNDIPAATDHLARYYTRARESGAISGEPARLAELEMDYWVVHRRLANERKAAPDHAGDLTPMVDALAALHAALFDASPDVAHRSAEIRAQAAARVDRITGGYSDDAEADWKHIQVELDQAYQILKRLGSQ
ncbi:MAG: hypothetical protein HY328_09750 [Chloroflexi bacterium]|nr:hypothetical protein [Chloroflexota bacterium]